MGDLGFGYYIDILTCSDHDNGGARCNDCVEEHVHQVDDVDAAEAVVVSDQSPQMTNHKHGVSDVRQDPPLALSIVLLDARVNQHHFMCAHRNERISLDCSQDI